MDTSSHYIIKDRFFFLLHPLGPTQNKYGPAHPLSDHISATTRILVSFILFPKLIFILQMSNLDITLPKSKRIFSMIILLIPTSKITNHRDKFRPLT